MKNLLDWLPFGKVAELSSYELLMLIEKDNAQMIDVRTEAEWRSSRIKGAINLPITRFSKAHIKSLKLDPNKPLITICLSAHRSIPAVRQLKQMGLHQTTQLKGGMNSWWREGHPVVKGQS